MARKRYSAEFKIKVAKLKVRPPSRGKKPLIR